MSTVRQIRTAMVLPGGWHFIQLVQGNRHKIEADTYEDLLDTVFQFRMDNGIEIGKIKKDVEDFICHNFPRWCQTFEVDVQDLEDEMVLKYGDNYVHSIIRWGESIERMLNDNPRLELVPKPIADERAKACVECPMNQDYEGRCPKCTAKAKRIFTIIRENKSSHYWKKLRGCSCFNHDNHTASFLPKDMLRASDKAPDRCWVNKELRA